jgi:hypothetical protein
MLAMATEKPKIEETPTPTQLGFFHQSIEPQHVAPDRRLPDENRRARERAAVLDSEAEAQAAGGRKGAETRKVTMEERRDKVLALALGIADQFRSSQDTWAAEIFDEWNEGEAPPRSTIVDDIRALQLADKLPPCSRK